MKAEQIKTINLQVEARSDFEAAFMKGFWHEVLNWFLQRKKTLIPFTRSEGPPGEGSAFDWHATGAAQPDRRQRRAVPGILMRPLRLA